MKFKVDRLIMSLHLCFMGFLSNGYGIDPFAEANAEDSGAGAKEYVHVRIQQRNGRKSLTTVQGLKKEYSYNKILKDLKKEFCCNGTVVQDPELGQVCFQPFVTYFQRIRMHPRPWTKNAHCKCIRNSSIFWFYKKELMVAYCVGLQFFWFFECWNNYAYIFLFKSKAPVRLSHLRTIDVGFPLVIASWPCPKMHKLLGVYCWLCLSLSVVGSSSLIISWFK